MFVQACMFVIDNSKATSLHWPFVVNYKSVMFNRAGSSSWNYLYILHFDADKAGARYYIKIAAFDPWQCIIGHIFTGLSYSCIFGIWVVPKDQRTSIWSQAMYSFESCQENQHGHRIPCSTFHKVAYASWDASTVAGILRTFQNSEHPSGGWWNFCCPGSEAVTTWASGRALPSRFFLPKAVLCSKLLSDRWWKTPYQELGCQVVRQHPWWSDLG